jgi:hypothetical protein
MRIVREETLLSCGEYANSREWKRTRKSLYTAIREVEWPPGSGSFTIYPESGKRRGEGNGVKPIKDGLMRELVRQGWTQEVRLDVKGIGKLDAALKTRYGLVALEWETGNISSSHRALNKMSLGLMKGVLACGILVVPSRNLYRYLTDRIGNMEELEPYLDLWRSIRCKQGVLEIVAIEYDATSTKVRRIPKMTAGRALA